MWKNLSLSIFISSALFAFAVSTAAQMTISGEIIDVIDGKTVLVAIPSGKVKVELQYIDVPETGQRLSDTVKEHLRQLAVGKPVQYRPKTLLRDRAIGQLKIKDVDISQQMLRDGAAWHIPILGSGQERTEYAAYASTEAAAKNEKLGVWSIPGLKPAWEFRADRELAKQREQNAYYSRPRNLSASARNNARIKKSAASNPAFGDVGALLNLYDPETKTGLLSTSFIPLMTDAVLLPGTESISLDVSYYYRETGKKSRDGSFVITTVFLSRNPVFPSGSDLILLDGDKKILVAKVRRKVAYQNYLVRETMSTVISRSMLERVAMNEGVMLKIGPKTIYLTGGRYLLYNILQVTG